MLAGAACQSPANGAPVSDPAGFIGSQLRAGPENGASERYREVPGVGWLCGLFWQNTASCGKVHARIGCQRRAGIFNDKKNRSKMKEFLWT
jgi:hypothetical protein